MYENYEINAVGYAPVYATTENLEKTLKTEDNNVEQDNKEEVEQKKREPVEQKKRKPINIEFMEHLFFR